MLFGWRWSSKWGSNFVFFLSIFGASFGDGAYAALGARWNRKQSSCIFKTSVCVLCVSMYAVEWELNPAGSQSIFLFGA